MGNITPPSWLHQFDGYPYPLRWNSLLVFKNKTLRNWRTAQTSKDSKEPQQGSLENTQSQKTIHWKQKTSHMSHSWNVPCWHQWCESPRSEIVSKNNLPFSQAPGGLCQNNRVFSNWSAPQDSSAAVEPCSAHTFSKELWWRSKNSSFCTASFPNWVFARKTLFLVWIHHGGVIRHVLWLDLIQKNKNISIVGATELEGVVSFMDVPQVAASAHHDAIC